MIAYLDTNVAIWLGQGTLSRLTAKAQRLVEDADVVISPMVLLEMEYLLEIGRLKVSSRDLQIKLESEIGARVCALSFSTIAWMALEERWTRDAFDRIIIANAKANGLAQLISADQQIARHYPRTVW